MKLLAFIPRPDIKNRELTQAVGITITSLSVAVFSVGALKHLIPGYLQIDPAALINPFIFPLTLVLNTVIFSAILFFICSMMLLPKVYKLQPCIFKHAIWVYAVLNILISLLFVIGLNRMIVIADMHTAINNMDLWIGGILATLLLLMTYWLLIQPVARYFNQYYRKQLSYILSITAVALTISANPVIAISYFDHAINHDAFCKQWAEINFKEQLEAGTTNKDYLVGQCLAAHPH